MGGSPRKRHHSPESMEPGPSQYYSDGTSSRKKRKFVAIRGPCGTCDEELTEDITPPHPITRKCFHAPITCIPCVRHWVNCEIENGRVMGIRCPDEECEAIMSFAEATIWASEEWAEHLRDRRRRRELERDPNYRWCLNPTCDSGQPHIRNTDGCVFECLQCGVRTCIICNKPDHTPTDCNPADVKDIIASERLLARKRCPNRECRVPVIHAGEGCHMVNCTVCGSEFCFHCLKLARPGLTRHYKGCPELRKPAEEDPQLSENIASLRAALSSIFNEQGQEHERPARQRREDLPPWLRAILNSEDEGVNEDNETAPLDPQRSLPGVPPEDGSTNDPESSLNDPKGKRRAD